MFRKSALISLSALLLAMPGQTETLQEALDLAFQTNPALEAQRAQIGVAREQLLLSGRSVAEKYRSRNAHGIGTSPMGARGRHRRIGAEVQTNSTQD